MKKVAHLNFIEEFFYKFIYLNFIFKLQEYYKKYIDWASVDEKKAYNKNKRSKFKKGKK